MKITRKAIIQVVESLLESPDNKLAFKFLDEKTIVRAKRRTYKRGRLDPTRTDIHLHLGRPNYFERQYLKRHGLQKHVSIWYTAK